MKRAFLPVVLISAACILCACQDMKQKDPVETEDLFTNIQGTETTVCAHEGCTNYIARSGDTLYCTEHSGICSTCGKYVDEGKTRCSQCLIDEMNSIEPTSQTSEVAAYK